MGTGKTKKQHRVKGDPEKLHLLTHRGGLDKMNFKDLQRRAIILGMPFPDVPQSDYFRLKSYIENTDNKPDNSLIDKYDDWMDRQLEACGYGPDDPMRSYQFRLGFVAEDPETGERKAKKVHGIRKPKKEKKEKVHHEKDTNGFWKGTKKSYTYELAQRGYDLERVIRRVQKKFPDANEKSVRQWYRASKRAEKK